MSKTQFEDIFKVLSVNKEGKAFDKVDRLECKSDTFEVDLLLDVHGDIFLIKENEKFKLALTFTLYESNNANDDTTANKTPSYYDPNVTQQSKILQDYEYVMYGKVYKYVPEKNSRQVSIYVSYGGLLMKLTGDPKYISDITPDSYVYLLVKKV